MLKVGKTTYRIDGEIVSEKEYIIRSRASKHGGERTKRRIVATWPLTPESIAINPEHVAATMEVDRKHGVPTEYTPDGSPIITGPAHYRRYLALHGFHHRNAGYGDRAPP